MSQPRDLPILFSGSMVRAILREIEQPGTGKTQTRRVVNPQPIGPLKGGEHLTGVPGMYYVGDTIWPIDYYTSIVSNKPGPHPRWVEEHVKIAAGVRLWVREAWRCEARLDKKAPRDIATNYPGIKHIATAEPDDFGIEGKFRQGMHMPRWASRITLIVTDVRVQRLQEISREDAIAEGLALASNQIEEFWRWPEPHNERLWASPIAAYQSLWDSLNAERGYGWVANPWVAAYTFRPILENIDKVPA